MWKQRVQDYLSSSPVFQNKTPKERKLIEARFDAKMHKIVEHKPKHPPYSEMIQRAIEALKEEGGSTETSISNYINSTYGDEQLPWAHSGFLAQHLRKLTESGELTSIPHYSLSLSRPGKQQQQQQQQPNSDDDADDDDGYDPSFTETSIRERHPGKSKEKHLSHRERRKKFRFQRQETQKEVGVETEEQPLLLQWPGKAMVDGGSGKEVMELEPEALNMESENNMQQEFGRLRLFEDRSS